MPDTPFALLITWTCYGTWLPGDERGHVSNTWSDDPSWTLRENTPGKPYREGDRFTRNSAQNRQNWPMVMLTDEQAACVASALVATAAARGWRILEAAVMANHVHVLIADCPSEGSQVRRMLKGNTQAALNKLTGKPWRWWTAGGSDRKRKGEEAIAASCEYVSNQQYLLARVHEMAVVSPTSSD